ncbi:MAG: chromate efflux transporter [Ktedonobacterales bacterium]
MTRPLTQPPPDRLSEVARVFLTFGFTAFGGPAAHIAMMRRELVQRRHWVTEERFLDLLGLSNVIPGPSSTELAIYLGYERAGWRGLVVAGTMFILPAVGIVLFLAWLYTQLGTLPQFGWAFYGIKPVIIAIIVQALVGLARTAVKTPLLAVMGLLAFAVYLLTNNPILVIFGIGLVVMLLVNSARWWKQRKSKPSASAAGTEALLWLTFLRQGMGQTAGRVPRILTLAATLAVPAVGLLPIFLTFLKIGFVTYGSGYTLLAFLRSDVVTNTHWITDTQLINAVAIGQFTPGPVFTTATFIGYLIAGVPGALVATLGIFLPSFILVALVYPLGSRIRQSPWLSGFLDGVNVAALALIAGVLILLGRAALVDWLTIALAAVALVILLRFKINSAWLVLGGAVMGLAVHLI